MLRSGGERIGLVVVAAAGAGLIASVVLAIPRVSCFADIVAGAILNLIAYGLSISVVMVAWDISRRRFRPGWPLAGGVIVVGATEYLCLGPFFLQIGGAPITGPFLVPILASAAGLAASLIGVLGALLMAGTTQSSRTGLCPACGYNRSGLAAGAKCPECGKAPG